MNSQIKSKPYIVKTVCYKGIPSGPQGFRKIIQNGFYDDVPSASSEHSEGSLHELLNSRLKSAHSSSEVFLRKNKYLEICHKHTHIHAYLPTTYRKNYVVTTLTS